MAENARAYDEQSNHQYKVGCDFIDELNLTKGAKVLDMGCGVGRVTKYIADIVGCEGQVIGVDPDEERIKLAETKYKDVPNLEFYASDSIKGFPHEDEPYYDAHISTTAFHWFPYDHKITYLKKAHHSLRPGGKLGLLSIAKSSIYEGSQTVEAYLLATEELKKILEDTESFANAVVKEVNVPWNFKSIDEFKRWFKASSHHDFDLMDESFKKITLSKALTFNDDGSVTLAAYYSHVTAIKE